jgi:3-hydroxyacyl-CoA dehydrogenase
MSSTVRSAREGAILVVEIDNPPVNALSPGVPEALAEVLAEAAIDPEVAAIVIRGAGRTFVAGADIATLEQAAWGDLSAAADLHELLARIEDSPKPVVMAIHGTALGGGLELAMAGHYRIAHIDALVGQPEVNLGIIPGAEGTQRLPRLAGVAKALEMCVSGKPISAADALTHHIVDEIVEGDLTAAAVEFATRVAMPSGPRRTRDLAERLGTHAVNVALYASARQLADKVRSRQKAPHAVIEAIEAATSLPFAEGCKREREIFFRLVRGDQARSLIHVFFAERAAAKPPADVRDARARSIETVAILGAGTMGTGIAMACANAGLEVSLSDESPAALDRGLETIRRNYEGSVSRGRLTTADVAARLSRIATGAWAEGAARADLVIEAVFEDMALKQQVFRDLARVARPDAILATNTSTLDIDAIASATSRPASVVGLHFFSPAHVMRLVEIVRGRATAPDVLATALGVARQLKKQAVVVGNGPGFVGNRLMFPYMYEMQFVVEEGATPQQVDRALTDFGMAMGIFAVDDMAGLDVGFRARQALGHFREAVGRRPLVHDRLVAMDRLGQKRGRGWYRYDAGRTPAPDPEVEALIRQCAEGAGIERRQVGDAEIVDRAICALVNEGARVLEEGLAARASDIDVIYTSGYGFPAWRGGPMLHADTVGLSTVLDRIQAFESVHGERWRPAALLVELARGGRRFRDWDRERAV